MTAAPPTAPLDGQVALVTGGASGIGLATASLLAAAGCHVLIADRDGDAGGDAVAAVERAAGSGEVAFVETDVADQAAVTHMVAVAVDRWGGLDIAVNNAGTTGTYAALGDQPLEDWERVLAVNLTATFLCLQAEVQAMLAAGADPATSGRRGGRAIVNVASAAGLIGFAHLPAYVASKHGVVGLTKSVALEYARRGIRVNAVCPGTVRTPMLRAFAGSDEAIDAMGAPTPIGRPAEPDEIAQAIVWLCSPAASYVTGQALPVDGGVLAT